MCVCVVCVCVCVCVVCVCVLCVCVCVCVLCVCVCVVCVCMCVHVCVLCHPILHVSGSSRAGGRREMGRRYTLHESVRGGLAAWWCQHL